MDGLLIDSEPHWKKAMQEVWVANGLQLPDEAYEKTVGIPTDEIVELWGRTTDWNGKSNQEIEQEILDKTEKLIQSKAELKEGALEILEFFKLSNFKMGLASSSSMRMIKGALKKFKLQNFFETLHSSEDHLYGKPHPAIYLACAKELGTWPEDCLVFEDSINGMISAKAAKMKVVAVPEKQNFQDERYALADLKLASLLDFTEKELHLLCE